MDHAQLGKLLWPGACSVAGKNLLGIRKATATKKASIKTYKNSTTWILLLVILVDKTHHYWQL